MRTVERVITWLRRFAVLALLSILPLWGLYVFQNTRHFVRVDGDLSKVVFGADHLAFYTGARLTRFGPEERLYDYPFVADYQNKLFWRDPENHEKDTWRWLEAFRNPPFYAMLYWPLCGCAYFWSAAAWLVISLGLTWLGVCLTTETRRGRAFLWTLSFLPTYMAFDYGQNTPISFAIFAGVYALLKKDRPFAAGLVAGLLLFKPQLLLGLGVWGLLDFKKKWPCALGVIVTCLLLFGTTYPIIPEAWKGFEATFHKNREFDSFDMYKMHNPLAFIRLLLPAEDLAKHSHQLEDVFIAQVRMVHNAFALACGAVALLVFIRLWLRRRNDLNVMFGGVVFFTLFAGPHALIYEWMLLALTGILWVSEWRDRPNTWFVLYALVWGVLYYCTDLSMMMLDWNLTGRLLGGVNSVFHQSVPVLAGVGFYAVKLLTKTPVSPLPP